MAPVTIEADSIQKNVFEKLRVDIPCEAECDYRMLSPTILNCTPSVFEPWKEKNRF